MSIYTSVEIVGTSPSSWEEAAQSAMANARKCIKGLRCAEVVRQDVTVEEGGRRTIYRVRLNLSFASNGDEGCSP